MLYMQSRFSATLITLLCFTLVVPTVYAVESFGITPPS